jgi:hypothetical protein
MSSTKQHHTMNIFFSFVWGACCKPRGMLAWKAPNGGGPWGIPKDLESQVRLLRALAGIEYGSICELVWGNPRRHLHTAVTRHSWVPSKKQCALHVACRDHEPSNPLQWQRFGHANASEEEYSPQGVKWCCMRTKHNTSGGPALNWGRGLGGELCLRSKLQAEASLPAAVAILMPSPYTG